MAKKSNYPTSQDDNESHFYDLNTDAIDRLANADKKVYDTPISDPAKAYKKGFLDKIPAPIKALFIKFWFNGAICFFVLWGLGIYVTDMLDMLVILSIIMGMVTDVLVNNAFRFLAFYPGSNDKWMMFPKKKYWTFFANILYSALVLYVVFWVYNLINIAYNSIVGSTDQLILGVEPLLFGIFYLGVDMLFIGAKNLFVKILSDAKEKNGI